MLNETTRITADDVQNEICYTPSIRALAYELQDEIAEHIAALNKLQRPLNQISKGNTYFGLVRNTKTNTEYLAHRTTDLILRLQNFYTSCMVFQAIKKENEVAR